jgi:hypothetical protein
MMKQRKYLVTEQHRHYPTIDLIEKDLYPTDIDQLDTIYVALEGIDFPITKQALITQCGEQQIYWSEETTITLGDILRHLPQQEFSSVSDLSAAISSVSEELFEKDTA